MVDLIYDGNHHLFNDWRQPWLNPIQLQLYADAVTAKGDSLSSCWGFIDGTVKAISRPSVYQRYVFNGHKRYHALKFQSIMASNGLIAHLFGPIEGRRHDCALLTESNILDQLDMTGNDRNGVPFCIYGDQAYPIRQRLLSPYKGNNLTVAQAAFNRNMSSCRQCVEWGFGDIVNNFSFLDFKKNLKLLLQPVGKYYIVGALLTNCRACLYKNQTSLYFGVDPPILENYLN
jgi:hypothetical protein